MPQYHKAKSKDPSRTSQSDDEYMPKTIKDAVERYIEQWDQADFDLLMDCPDENKLDFLCANISGDVISRCSLDDHNIDLLEACGSKDMSPKDAARVIVKALWQSMRS